MEEVILENKEKSAQNLNDEECGENLFVGHRVRPSHSTLSHVGQKRQNKMGESPRPKVKRLSYDEQMEILRRLHGMETGKQLAHDFGVSCTTITVLKRKFGIPVMKKGPKQDIKKLTEDDKIKIATRLAKEAGASVMRDIVMGSKNICDIKKKNRSEQVDHKNMSKKRLPLHDKIRIIEKLKSMESESDIGRQYGVCSKTVCSIREQYEQILHLAFRKRHNAVQHMSDDKDSKRRHTRLTINQKVEILLRLKNNEQGKILAQEYGVGTSTISDIKKAEEKILYIAEKQGVDLDDLTVSREDSENLQYVDSDSADSETGSTYTHVTCDVGLVEGDDLDSEENETSECSPKNEQYKEQLCENCDKSKLNSDMYDEVDVKVENDEFINIPHGEAYAALSTAIKWAQRQIEIDTEQINIMKSMKNIAFRKHLLNISFDKRNSIDA